MRGIMISTTRIAAASKQRLTILINIDKWIKLSYLLIVSNNVSVYKRNISKTDVCTTVFNYIVIPTSQRQSPRILITSILIFRNSSPMNTENIQVIAWHTATCNQQFIPRNCTLNILLRHLMEDKGQLR